MLLIIFLVLKRQTVISNVLLNNIDSQTKQDIFTDKYKDKQMADEIASHYWPTAVI